MNEENKIEFLGKTYDLNALKGGITRKDLEKNPKLIMIFEKLDTEKNGHRDGFIDAGEVSLFNKVLKKFAGNSNLSKKEADSLLNSYGIEGDYNDLKSLMDILDEKSKQIKSISQNEQNNSTVIEYNEGHSEEFLADGTKISRSKESKDDSLKDSFKMDITFHYISDAKKKQQDIDLIQEQSVLINAESEIIQRYGKENIIAEAEYNDDNKIKSKIFYKSGTKTPVCIIDYTDKGDIEKVDVLSDDKWIRTNFYPDYGSHSIAELNFDRTAIISETCYVDEKALYNRHFNPNGDKIQESVFDLSTGKISCIYDFNDRGQKIKIQQFNENEELTSYELREYHDNLPVLKQIKLFDADNRLQKTTVYELGGEEKEYDAKGNLIEKEESYSFHEYLSRLFNTALDGNKQSVERIINNLDLNTVLKTISDYKDNPKAAELLKEILTGKLESLTIDPNEIWNLDNKKMLEEAHGIISGILKNAAEADNLEDMVKIAERANEKLQNLPTFVPNLYTKKDVSDGKIDSVTYQGQTGDCWLLASINSINETNEAGQKYLKDCISVNTENRDVTVQLLGGKKEYVLTRKELENADNLSNGDIDLRALELAFAKYFQEYKPDGTDNIDAGNWEKVALSILSGNDAVDACKEDGIIGVNINNEFVALTKDNLNKLRHIPICVSSLTEDDLRTLAALKTDVAICVNSHRQDSAFSGVAHAFYVKNINQNSVDVKEPNNTENIVTYSYEDFLKTYNYGDTVLFIP